MTYRDSWKLDVDGHQALRELHETLRQEIAVRWHRSLPFAEELFDRWERASTLGFGDGASIYDSSLVIGDVSVGAGVWIGPFTILDGSGGLTIGRFCSVSAGVQIYTHDTVAWAVTGGRAEAISKSVEIGDYTYLGPNSIVTSGVNIGSQCVIGAGALVNKSVPSNMIVFGVPGRVVGRVEADDDSVRLIYEGEFGDSR